MKRLLAVLVILAMLGVCLAMVGVLVFGIRAIPSTISRNVSIQLDPFDQRAEADEEKSFEVSGPVTLDISNHVGDIEIRTGESGVVKMQAHKVGSGRTQEEAQAELEKLVITAGQTGNTIRIRVEPEKNTRISNGQQGSVSFVLTVPENTIVLANSEFGKVTLNGTHGSAEVHSSFGSVTVEDVLGKIEASSDNGSVLVKKIEAGKENIGLTSGFGRVELINSAGNDVTLRSDNGQVVLDQVEASGAVKLNSSFGKISFDGGSAQTINATSNNGGVELKNLVVKEKVLGRSDFGGVIFEAVKAAEYEASSSNGRVDLSGVSGKVKANTEFGSLTITEGEKALLDLRTANGPITYQGSLADGDHTVSSEFGSVTLKLPSSTSVNVDLKTELGKIRSDFELSISGALSDKQVTGKIGSGGGLLKVKSNNGGVNLVKVD